MKDGWVSSFFSIVHPLICSPRPTFTYRQNLMYIIQTFYKIINDDERLILTADQKNTPFSDVITATKDETELPYEWSSTTLYISFQKIKKKNKNKFQIPTRINENKFTKYFPQRLFPQGTYSKNDIFHFFFCFLVWSQIFLMLSLGFILFHIPFHMQLFKHICRKN